MPNSSTSVPQSQAFPLDSASIAVPSPRLLKDRIPGLLPPLLLLLAVCLLLYWHIAIHLVGDWYNNPDLSHGFLIPIFIAFLVWTDRERFLETPISQDWNGVPIVALGLFTLLVGVFGADLFLQRFSFLIFLVGAVWSLLGRNMLRQLRFPLGLILLAIPLPSLVLNHITFPLQLLASRSASAMLPLAGVPVLREGNVINLPAMQLEVAEACSGIRSLMSLLTVAIIFGYFMEKSPLRRVLLALASIPIAVAANAARIFGTGLCVQYWDPEKAMGFFHEFSGWLMFLVSMSLLYCVHLAMGRIGRKTQVVA